MWIIEAMESIRLITFISDAQLATMQRLIHLIFIRIEKSKKQQYVNLTLQHIPKKLMFFLHIAYVSQNDLVLQSNNNFL